MNNQETGFACWSFQWYLKGGRISFECEARLFHRYTFDMGGGEVLKTIFQTMVILRQPFSLSLVAQLIQYGMEKCVRTNMQGLSINYDIHFDWLIIFLHSIKSFYVEGSCGLAPMCSCSRKFGLPARRSRPTWGPFWWIGVYPGVYWPGLPWEWFVPPCFQTREWVTRYWVILYL